MEDTVDTTPAVQIFSKDNCAPCVRAKRLLDSMGVRYAVVDLTGDLDGMMRVARMTGRTTLPQIVVGNELIGGLDDLAIAINNPRIREALLAA
ncbi:MAG TPA: glutaredoxin domain-containing protein [Solirubrobacterales bacterium]|jgi:glutaredoxin|nr:glutaredoxin domain-containing protein [Solirubrobacterales bacterium]